MSRFVFLLVLPLLLVAATGTVTQTFEFAPGDFIFDREDGFDVVALPGHYWTAEPGNPLLPIAVYNVLIPPDAEVVGVDVVSSSGVVLPGVYDVHPAQHAQAFSLPASGFIAPDPIVYSSDKPYPAEPAVITPSGSMAGYRVAGIRIAPLRYTPARKQLELITRIEVAVRYERNRHEVPSLDPSQVELAGEQVRAIVRNAAEAKEWAPLGRETDDWLCDMMVITSNALASSFQPFVDWKSGRGIKTAVVRTESIYSAYPGRDNQEKIRNCVIEYWRNHGLKWVLLGGDAEIVPVRLARITCEGNTEDIATDMYYADLQYSWDSDHNNYFGEMTDSVDLFHDLLIGRTPADNAGDVALFFAKCTTYERNPDTVYLKKGLMGSTMLFTPFHGRVVNRMIAELFPTGWQFSHLEDPPSGQYASGMSAGAQISHVAAHGNQTSFSVMSASEAPGLTNGLRKLCFVNSIACQSGWFDGYECLAEALVKAQNGGAIATMLNSRYGFGYPPGFGPSEMLDLQFYRYFIGGNAHQFGMLAAMSKDYFQSLTMGQEVWRWCVYELNLFGDPSLGMWTERPAALTLRLPGSVPTGPQVIRVAAEMSGVPVPAALVCATKGTETYARGWTNSRGWVDLYVNPATTGDLDVSVSVRNCYPRETLVTVTGTSGGPVLLVGDLRIDDGDGNGRLDPGEDADIYVSLANAGAASATGVTARLRALCPHVTVVDSEAAFGTIAPGDTITGDRFRVSVAGNAPNGTEAEFIAACSSPQGSWEPFFGCQIGPAPLPKKLWADHDTGNMILSVTTLGSIGTLGPYREGSGLKYPRDAGYGSLYFTSFACGNAPGYVVDRWYGQPTSTWNADWHAVDTLRAVLPPIAAHEEYQCVIDDGAHPSPKGLTVTQWSGALADERYRDFVVLSYIIENRGASPINDLYAGILSDFDVNNTTSNNVYSDAGRRLVYMTRSTGYTNSAGIKVLSPAAAANLSAIDHAIYVTPGGMMTEAVKDSFLRGSIRVPQSNRAANWSCVASAGSFNLAPGARVRVAFALVGGNTEQEMLAHADSAQSWYDNQMPMGLTYYRGIIDDAAGGNGDGIINPGEAINLPTWVVNRSDRGSSGVRGILRKTSADTLVTVTDSVRYFGTVGAGDSAFTGSDGFKFRVAASCTNNYLLPFSFVCIDTLDSTFVSSPGLRVGAPQLVQSGITCWDPRPGGNNNGRLDPGEEAEIALGLANVGLGNCENVSARLRSGDVRLAVLDSTGAYGNIPHDSTVYNADDRYRVRASGTIPPETRIPCTLLVTGTGYSATRAALIPVGALTSIDPIPDGPRTPPLYYAFDDVDSFYVERPDFEWVEVRNQGTRLTLSDDQTVVLNLPPEFGPFRYYGQDYTQVSVCGNGWVAPGSTTLSAYSNTELPSTSLGAPALCVNWDDLYPPTGGGVWYWYDAARQRFVIEWDSVAYYSPRTTFEKNEIILYDTTQASRDGNCEFVFQYLTNGGMTSSTVGEQDPSRTIGIQALFSGAYHRAAAPIVAGRAIKFTSDSAVTGIEGVPPAGLRRPTLRASPNPVRSAALVRFSLPSSGRAKLTVLDVSGRVVRLLADGGFERGEHMVSWDRRDNAGRTAAAGVYLYRLETESGAIQRKAVVVR